MDAREGYSTRLGYLTSFYGLIDLAAIAPWYIEVVLSLLGLPYESYEILVVLRVFRVFQIEHLVRAFAKLDVALGRCRPNLAAFGLVALIIWVTGGTLFYLFESSPSMQPIVGMREAFGSVPSSMYFLCIFLGGEWGLTDFSVPGKFLCVCLVLVGIELYAIPVSVLFDAFAEALDESSPNWAGRNHDRDEDGSAPEREGLLWGALSMDSDEVGQVGRGGGGGKDAEGDM